MISIKLLCNFTGIALRHGCSPLNLLHIFRKPFPKNTSGWLFLIVKNLHTPQSYYNLYFILLSSQWLFVVLPWQRSLDRTLVLPLLLLLKIWIRKQDVSNITWNVGYNVNRFVVSGTLTNEVACGTDAVEGVIVIIVLPEVVELYTGVRWRVSFDDIA